MKPRYSIKCPICKRTNEADQLNPLVLDLDHHPKCDYHKGMPISYDGCIDDRSFEE